MRNYTRKTKRGLVPEELMHAAAHEVLNRGASMKKTAKENNICHTTLFRFIRKIKSGENPTVGYKARHLFSREQEQEILKHLSEYAKVFCGLTLDDVRKFACQYAIRLKYTNIPESWFKNGKASKDWADKFAKRHQLPLKPTKEVIDINKCYSILHTVMEEHKFLPSRIYHLVDMSIVTKVVKSKTNANGSVSMSVGQRKPVNMQFAANAEGETVPPMFVTDEYKATNVIKNNTGRMTSKDFPKYLNNFIQHTKPNEANPVLLLIDEQQYIDVNVLERARPNSVILLSFPLSHNIQPLKKIAKNILESCKTQVNTNRLCSKSDRECDILEVARKVIAEVRKKDIVKCFRKAGVWPFNPNTVTGEDFVPTAVEEYDFKVSEHDAQPGPSKVLDTRTPLDSAGREQGKESRAIEQCRFCGEFSKDCVAVSGDMTYLAGNQTALALNDTRVQLDFNDRSLPNAVCRDCDAKLQEFCDFVQVVKAAQGTLINVAEEKEELETTADLEETTTDVEENAEYEEAETLVVKTEYDSQQEDSDDDKEGIVDCITFGETVFVKETHKRKRNTDTAKAKKLKSKEKCEDDLVIDIKEEVVEKDANDGHGLSEVSDIGTDVKPSELELATSALVLEMAGDGTSEYQEYRSDR